MAIARRRDAVGRAEGAAGAVAAAVAAAEFHLLDEPTNHLDIEGQEDLEAELLAPEATCLLVSHDRHFVRAVGSRFWEIRGKRLEEVDGPEGFFAAMRQ